VVKRSGILNANTAGHSPSLRANGTGLMMHLNTVGCDSRCLTPRCH
jgi:hypothetical protein